MYRYQIFAIQKNESSNGTALVVEEKEWSLAIADDYDDPYRDAEKAKMKSKVCCRSVPPAKSFTPLRMTDVGWTLEGQVNVAQVTLERCVAQTTHACTGFPLNPRL